MTTIIIAVAGISALAIAGVVAQVLFGICDRNADFDGEDYSEQPRKHPIWRDEE